MHLARTRLDAVTRLNTKPQVINYFLSLTISVFRDVTNSLKSFYPKCVLNELTETSCTPLIPPPPLTSPHPILHVSGGSSQSQLQHFGGCSGAEGGNAPLHK